MKIAVLGWGSLIWAPRNLATDTAWRPGPRLPVEFARKSQGGRVTLVLLQAYRPSRAFWALSSFSDVREACSNLRSRERCASRDIHFTTGDGLRTGDGGDPSLDSHDVSREVEEWLQTKDLDAAVWTGLPPKGFPRLNPASLAVDVVTYLRKRGGEEFENAKQYVQRAPSTIRTPVRVAIEDSPLQWMPEPLPEDIFEADTTL